MKLYKYKSYEHYRSTQEKGNKRKINNVFVYEPVIDIISEYINKNIKNPSFGICHGTRRGVEQQMFIEKTGANVVGTEISSTATQFPNTIEWDFHNVMDEWINSVDFIYSNSIDHSYDPVMALTQWLSCLNDNGLCFIEYTNSNHHFNRLDCFASSPREMKLLLEEVGNIRDIIKFRAPPKKGRKKGKLFIIFAVTKK